MDGNAAPHFHIRWIIADSSRVDWEAFASHEEAETVAKRIVSRLESYAIEEGDSSCERCARFRLAQEFLNGST